MNSNAGITNANCFERENYQKTFDDVFEGLRQQQLFQRSIPDTNSLFSDFFTEGHAELLKGLRVGLVAPQQSLHNSISKPLDVAPSALIRLLRERGVVVRKVRRAS